MDNKAKDESNNGIEKYKELYDLSKEVFSEELGRSARIDDKASKYLTVITFLLGAYAFFCKRILDSILPPKSFLEWFLVIVAGLLLLFLIIAWFIIFWIFKIHEFIKIPIDIDFFKDNKLIDVYYGLSKGIKINLLENRKQINRKSKNLYYGYISICVIVVTLVILSILFATHAWLNQTIKINPVIMRSTTMVEDPKEPKPEKPTEQEPNYDITPPNFDLVTEGFDPSKPQKKIEIREKKIE